MKQLKNIATVFSVFYLALVYTWLFIWFIEMWGFALACLVMLSIILSLVSVIEYFFGDDNA
jgi:hypothetical protein